MKPNKSLFLVCIMATLSIACGKKGNGAKGAADLGSVDNITNNPAISVEEVDFIQSFNNFEFDGETSLETFSLSRGSEKIEYTDSNKIKFDLILNNLQSTSSLIRNLKKSVKVFYNLFQKYKPKIILVQGDTTTAAACAYTANLLGICVAHNEAGLRTFDTQNPYPEELNRKLITSVSDIHFAPTILNKKNLINEGVDEKDIYLVGNPGIDSFFSFLKKILRFKEI